MILNLLIRIKSKQSKTDKTDKKQQKKKTVLFTNDESNKKKCFQSGFKKRDSNSTLYIVI